MNLKTKALRELYALTNDKRPHPENWTGHVIDMSSWIRYMEENELPVSQETLRLVVAKLRLAGVTVEGWPDEHNQ